MISSISSFQALRILVALSVRLRIIDVLREMCAGAPSFRLARPGKSVITGSFRGVSQLSCESDARAFLSATVSVILPISLQTRTEGDIASCSVSHRKKS
jgi:hypothetical protein